MNEEASCKVPVEATVVVPGHLGRCSETSLGRKKNKAKEWQFVSIRDVFKLIRHSGIDTSFLFMLTVLQCCFFCVSVCGDPASLKGRISCCLSCCCSQPELNETSACQVE